MGDAPTERHEAVALLKEIVGTNLIQPSIVTLEQKAPDSYKIVMKGNIDTQPLKQIISEKKLAILEDKEKNCCIIYIP